MSKKSRKSSKASKVLKAAGAAGIVLGGAALDANVVFAAELEGELEAQQQEDSVKILVWWADYFNVSMDYLTCRTNQPQGQLYEYRPQPTATSEGMKQFIEMCFDPASPFNNKLKETLFKMMEKSKK